MGCSQSSFKRKVCSTLSLPQEKEKSHISNLTAHLKELEKGELTKPKVSTREKSQKSEKK